MFRVQFNVGINLKVQSNRKFSKHLLPSLSMNLSGEANTFSVKYFISQ